MSAKGLPWIRFDTTLPDHPKMLELLGMRDGHRSAFVFCCALAYAGKHGTDGFIPQAALNRINGRKQDAVNLVAVGLFDSGDKGWWCHGYDEYQQVSTTTEQIKASQKDGSVKGNCRRWHGEDCGCWRDKVNLRALP